MKKLIVSLALVSLLAACATPKPKVADPVPTPEAAVVTPPADTGAVTDPAVESNGIDLTSATPVATVFDPSDPLSDTKSILAKRSVYYALDSYAVEEADKAIVLAHAKYLSEHPARKVRLEGNADERGSNEYNLALGQKRADAVKKMLILGGAKDSQIEAASYGEEKPKAMGHDESSWAQNRRTDLNY